MVGLWHDRRGVVALYVAFLSALVLGAGAIAIDVGRMVALKTQMQNAADSAALSAAAQLDGRPGAITRATQVAQTTIQQRTGLATGTGDLTVQSVNFFSAIDPSRVATNVDQNALFVQVKLASQDIALLLKPVLDAFTGSGSDSLATLGASALATLTPIICDAPPLMLCDLRETLGPSADLFDSSNVGRQLVIKFGPGTGSEFAPGNYNLLCTDDGDCGAAFVRSALAADGTGTCRTNTVQTAPGVAAGPVANGINVRFDIGNVNPKNPARNVINYPRDSDMSNPNTMIGNANWDPASYWSAKHNGETLPLALTTGGSPTRYQTYLYELAEPFARNGNLTIYPLPDDPNVSLPSGFTEVTVPQDEIVPVAANPQDSSDPDFDGVPQSTPVQDPKRRVFLMAVVSCLSQNISGRSIADTKGRYVEVFMTEHIPFAQGQQTTADVYGELVGPLIQITGSGPVFPTGSPDFHINVRLVE